MKDASELMPHARLFFDHCRGEPSKPGVMGPSLDPDEVSGANVILSAMEGLPIAWAAYALATAWHETGHTMQPVKERGGPRYFTRLYDVTGSRPSLARKMGNTTPGDGPRYCGRGYVQLTWKSNYYKAGKKLGVDLVGNPNLAMQREVAAKIMRHGMREGWFTGKRFDSYLPAHGMASRKQFSDARRIINGTDRAAMIAGYAVEFQEALKAGGWPW